MDNGCALSFYALSLLFENWVNLVFYNGECQRAVSPSLSVKNKNNLFWLLTYLPLLFIPCLDIFISIIVFGSLNQSLDSKETEFLWSRFMIQYEKFWYLEMQSPKSRRIGCQDVFNSFPRGDLKQVPGDSKDSTNGVNFQINLHRYQGVLGDLTIINFKLLYRWKSYFILSANTVAKHRHLFVLNWFWVFLVGQLFLNAPEISNAANVWISTSGCKHTIAP